eukprot:621346-Hanusia_phi.AAC.1
MAAPSPVRALRHFESVSTDRTVSKFTVTEETVLTRYGHGVVTVRYDQAERRPQPGDSATASLSLRRGDGQFTESLKTT